MSQTQSQTSDQPVTAIRYGAIKASIWKNETKFGSMYSVTASRAYKDGNAWKESQSFAFHDLLTLAKALNDAHSAIARLEEADRQPTVTKRSFASRGKHALRI